MINQTALYDQFSTMVLLSAPAEVLLSRITCRANPFGATAADQTNIAADLASYESLLRAGADHEIVTTAPITTVADALEDLAITNR